MKGGGDLIDSSIIDEIKYRNDLVDVISSYVSLKRAGSGYTGLCPFHSEKTPSFHVAPEKGFFHCFGCGAGGDVITFIMRIENLSYPEAVRFLAARAGIPMEEERTAGGVSRGRIRDMNRDAARFFFEQLKESPEAQAYLSRRGLGSATIKHFGIGFSPNSPGALHSHMRSLGYTDEELVTGFLCGISKKTGRPYDYFRNRVMFPVIDTTGAVIAFGGRVMDDSQPKYLNTSDTPAFTKRRSLFALNFAKNSADRGFILCEGYMDVIALHESGFSQAIATLGTAITTEQARLMRKYTDRVFISYDSDAAGQKAAKRAFELLGEAGIDCRIIRMHGAKDPDEYIRKFGRERFAAICGESLTQFDYEFDNALKKYDIGSDAERIKAADELSEFIAGVGSAVEREVYIGRTAERLGLSADNVRTDVGRIMRRRDRRERSEAFTARVRQTSGMGDRVNPDRVKNLAGSSAEDVILGLLLLYSEQTPFVRNCLGLVQNDFVTEFGRRLYGALLELYGTDPPGDWGMLAGSFSTDEMSRISDLRSARMNLGGDPEKLLTDCVDKLRESKKKDISLEDLINEKRHDRKRV